MRLDEASGRAARRGYLTALAISDRKVATIERALMAICQAHELHGFPSPRKAPEVTEVLQGIRSTIGVGPELERLVTGVVLIRR